MNKIRIKRRSLKGRAKFCPRCFSSMSKVGSLSGWILPEEYYCSSCGYRGYVALERALHDSDTNEKEAENS